MNKVISSREFNQDTSSAKRFASDGPVIITDRGKPAHVLMTYQEFSRLTDRKQRVTDMLGIKSELETELELELPARTDYPRGEEFL